MSKFIDSADSRQTSPEILEAILWLAGGDEVLAAHLWEDGVDERQFLALWERVTGNGVRDETDYFWGTEGSRWAASARRAIGAE